jgi:hypothetical protein
MYRLPEFSAISVLSMSKKAPTRGCEGIGAGRAIREA